MADIYDPYSHELHDDPYPVYEYLREVEPVHVMSSYDAVAISRFDDVWAAVHDWSTFSSASGILLERADLASEDGSGLPMMIMMDPPRHNSLRKLVSRAFTPRRVDTMAAQIRSMVQSLLGDMAEAGGGELVGDLAAPLPSAVIAHMLGVSPDDQDDFRVWSDRLLRGDPASPELTAASLEAVAALMDYFSGVVSDRRERPGDDLVSALVEAEIDGERLTDEETIWSCILLLVAGNETTTNLISNAAVSLAQHDDARRALVDAPGEPERIHAGPIRGFETVPVRFGSRPNNPDRVLGGHRHG